MKTKDPIKLDTGLLLNEKGEVLGKVNQPKKHTPPLRCILRRAIVGVSPAAMMIRCRLGLWRDCKLCKGCSANIHEIWVENFQKGLEEGLKDKAKRRPTSDKRTAKKIQRH